MYDRVTIHCLYSADSIWLSNRKKRAVTPPPAELRLQLDMSDFDWLPMQEQAEAEPKSNADDKKHTPDMEETTIKEAVAVAVPVPPPPHLARRHVSPAQALVRVTRRHNGDSDSLKKVESERRSWSTTAQKGAVESTSTSPSRDDSLKHADHNIEAALGFPTNPLPDDHHPESYGWYQEHLILESYDTEPWTSVQHLGHGSLGVVDEVRRTATHLPTLVRKRVQLPTQRRTAAKIRAIMQEEAAVLGRLHHPNIITLIGSYEDRTRDKHSVYCLLLHPVGENDLESFLAIASEPDLDTELRDRYQSWIRRWYADLASALMYMHCNGVRHQDIKPSNIIHKGNHVFFTDFSSSGNFKVGQTTSTANPARATAMYASPEVSDTSSTMARHGRPSDVFGLGCVFCDMLTVEGGRTVSAFHDYLLKEENEVRLRYSERSLSILQWLVEIGIYVKPRKLIADMLLRDQELRPSAEGVYDHWKRYERNASQNNRNIVPDEQAARRPDG